jgi:hypothetical protein
MQVEHFSRIGPINIVIEAYTTVYVAFVTKGWRSGAISLRLPG